MSQKNVTLPFNLRPQEYKKLGEVCQGNKSYVLRKWLDEYLEAPTQLEPIDDRLVQTSMSMPEELRGKLENEAKRQNVSVMALTRLIIEHNLKQNHS